MPRKRKNRIKARRQTTIKVERGLLTTIPFLSILALALIFRIGESLWPVWLVEHRSPLIAILLLISIVLLILSPIIIEYSEKPRSLSSGPGKNPYIDP